MGDDKNVRHRFTVPAADNVVNEWIDNQSNLGFSLRVLIRAFVRQHGNKDATCVEFGEPVAKRGRPPKQATIQLNGMIPSYDGYYESDAEEGDIENEPIVAETVRPVNETVVQAPAQRVVQPTPSVDSVDNFFGNGNAPNRVTQAKPVVAASNNQQIMTNDGFVDPDDLI